MTGQRFGMLTVIERAGSLYDGIAAWKCRCDCGNYKNISGSNLRTGKTKSCGCASAQLSRERARKLTHAGNHKHGGSNTRLYRIWINMKSRCGNESVPAYKFYGQKGVSVCDEWKNFKFFQIWALSNGYSKDLTIDRINPFGIYEPSNCRWITLSAQQHNKRKDYNLEVNTHEGI